MRLDEPTSPDPSKSRPELTILDPDDEDGLDDDAPRTVLITGASGNIGRKLRAAWGDLYDLVLLDLDPRDDHDVYAADLADPDAGWIEHFQGVDAVVHLAGNPNEFAEWDDLEAPNLDALANVLNASVLAGVDRVVFASSNHAMGDYRHAGDGPITVDLPPKPDGPYGATKLMGERLGMAHASAFDLTFVALRIGWVQRGENRPETLPDDWARAIWLSNADLVRLFTCAVEADLDAGEFVVVNGLSNNRGTRWSLSEAADWLDYHPADGSGAAER